MKTILPSYCIVVSFPDEGFHIVREYTNHPYFREGYSCEWETGNELMSELSRWSECYEFEVKCQAAMTAYHVFARKRAGMIDCEILLYHFMNSKYED